MSDAREEREAEEPETTAAETTFWPSAEVPDDDAEDMEFDAEGKRIE